MKRYGYEPKLGLCSIAAAGPLAILIPPSTPIIIYGILAQTSVGKLFMAGWLPGILLTLLLCITTAVLVKLRPAWAPRAEKTTLTEKLRSLKAAWPILLLVVFIMVCIWGGITTVNEAARHQCYRLPYYRDLQAPRRRKKDPADVKGERRTGSGCSHYYRHSAV